MTTDSDEFLNAVKALVVDPLRRIELDDLVTLELGAALTALSEFSLSEPSFSAETASDRVMRMSAITSRLRTIAILVVRWGSTASLPTLQKIFSRLADANQRNGGTDGWVALSWFPFVLVSYAAGIAALDGERYDSLAAMFRARRWCKGSGDEHDLAYCHAFQTLMTAGRKAFNVLPTLTNQHVALSELLAEYLRSELNALVGIGPAFDAVFDEFEVLLTLCFANDLSDPRRFWGLYGRFVYREGYGGGPFKRVELAAELKGNKWGPIEAGLFGGDINRFREVQRRYRDEVLPRQRQHGW